MSDRATLVHAQKHQAKNGTISTGSYDLVICRDFAYNKPFICD